MKHKISVGGFPSCFLHMKYLYSVLNNYKLTQFNDAYTIIYSGNYSSLILDLRQWIRASLVLIF